MESKGPNRPTYIRHKEKIQTEERLIIKYVQYGCKNDNQKNDTWDQIAAYRKNADIPKN